MIINKTGVTHVNNLAELNSLEIKRKGQRVKVADTTGDAVATNNAFYEWTGTHWQLDKQESKNKEVEDKLICNDVDLDTLQEVADAVNLLKSTSAGSIVSKTTATQTNNTTTLSNIAELSLPLNTNSIYEIKCFVTFRSSSTACGLNLGIITPTGSVNNVEIVVPISNTAAASQLRTIFPNASVATNVGNIVGTGVTTVNSNQTAMINGIITTSNTAGNCQIRFAAEVSGSTITIQPGSILTITKLA